MNNLNKKVHKYHIHNFNTILNNTTNNSSNNHYHLNVQINFFDFCVLLQILL